VDQLEVIRQAAQLAELSIDTWVPLVLEDAARAALGTELAPIGRAGAA